HIETLNRMDNVRPVAVVDPAASAKTLAAGLGIPCMASIGELIDSGLASAVIVATPNETHLSVSEAFLRAGIPVLLEKPVAESLASALRLVSVADETRVPLLIGHHR